MSKNLRKPSVINEWAVNCGGSKGCYIISMDAMSNIIWKLLLKGMAFTKRNAPLSLSLALFFHRKSEANQTIIWLWPKQHQASKNLYNFSYFFQILGRRSTHTVNLNSEFSCKSRFAKVNFAIMSYLWKPKLTFCSWDRPTVFSSNYKLGYW